MIEGKIANRFRPTSGRFEFTSCGKCNKQLPAPKLSIVSDKMSEPDHVLTCVNYIGTEHFVYETKGGKTIEYCSKYCRNKHNHRFTRNKNG